MADPVYDIAAISTNSAGGLATFYGTHSTTASAGASTAVSQQVASLIGVQMLAAGWTAVASATSNSRISVDYVGAQSPWYDEDAVPSWYTQNIPWLRVNPSPSATQVQFTPGIWNGTAGTNTSTTALAMALSGATGRVHSAWSNPFQVIVRDHGNQAVGFFMSALHIPDFVQERVQIKNCMFATQQANFSQRFFCDGARVWTVYESNITGTMQNWEVSDSNNTPLIIQQGGGGVRAQNNSGKFVWNPTGDADMNSFGEWYPMMCPPTIAWDPATPTTGTLTATPKALGMLWDCLLINKRYAFGSVVEPLPETPDDKRLSWIVLSTSDADATRQAGSLIFITDTYTP